MNKRGPGDSVPAISECEATGEIATIFADIRTSLGTSSVNLIWRHLATIPGALTWCWSAIAPLHRHGELGHEARNFRRGLKGPTLPQLPPEVLAILELKATDIELICSTMRGYQMSCTMNILSLNALLLLLKDSPGGANADATPAPTISLGTAPALQTMARLLSPEEMSSPVADLAWRLNSLYTPGDPILASLYRYLANWPSFLALTWALLAPIEMDGRLRTAIEQSLTDADARVPSLLSFLAPPAERLDLATSEIVCKALEDFARGAIVKVIPITRVLLTALGSPLED